MQYLLLSPETVDLWNTNEKSELHEKVKDVCTFNQKKRNSSTPATTNHASYESYPCFSRCFATWINTHFFSYLVSLFSEKKELTLDLLAQAVEHIAAYQLDISLWRWRRPKPEVKVEHKFGRWTQTNTFCIVLLFILCTDRQFYCNYH